MLDLASRKHRSPENEDDRKPWRWMLIDSAIIGGIAGFAALGNQPPGWPEVWVAVKAFTGAFLMQLAVERGLKRPPETEDTGE